MKHTARPLAPLAIVLGVIVAFLGRPVIALGGEAKTHQSTAGHAVPRVIDDVTLMRVARAFVRVGQITKRERQVLRSTKDQATKQKVVTEAESEKIAAVTDEGVEPTEYNTVLLAVQGNQVLRHKFLAFVSQANRSSFKHLM